MLARWQELLEKFAELSTRERMLVLIAIFAVSYQLADLVILDRQYQQMGQMQNAAAEDNAAIARLSGELNALANSAQDDPNKPLRADVIRTRSNVEALRLRLKALTSDLISPQDMARFVEELLLQEPKLTLIRLQTLDAKPLLDVDGTLQSADLMAAALHRHDFSIEFAGDYMATLRYLQALEALPWRFFWDSVSYEVEDYPRSLVRLRLHTLSLSEDWIGV